MVIVMYYFSIPNTRRNHVHFVYSDYWNHGWVAVLWLPIIWLLSLVFLSTLIWQTILYVLGKSNSCAFLAFLMSDLSLIYVDFTFTDTSLEVVQVPYSSYEACKTNGWVWYASASAQYQFTTAGTVYFVADTPQYCVQGMRFAANIYNPTTTNASSPTTPSSSSPPPPSTTPPKPATPPPSPFGSPTTNTSSSPSSTNVGAIAGGTVGGVVLTILSAAYAVYNKWHRPAAPKQHVTIYNSIGGDVSQNKSTNGTDTTPGNATDEPMIDVETKNEPRR